MRRWLGRAAAPAPDDVTPGWQLVRFGSEGVPVHIDGVNPWEIGPWGPHTGVITVAHPTYPDQRHTMSVYEVPGASGPVVFAAGEFSNGAWGLYRPVSGERGRSRS